MPDDPRKNDDDDDNIERLLSMFKALVGFFLVPVLFLLIFNDGSRSAERRVDPNDVQPPPFQQQQQHQLPPLQRQDAKVGGPIQDVTWWDVIQ